MKSVFFGAEHGTVLVTIDSRPAGVAFTAKELLKLLRKHNVTHADKLMQSSDFEFDPTAERMLNKALDNL